MITVDKLSGNGEKIGQVELPEIIFGTTPNKAVLYEVIRAYQMNQRQGTASAKSRAMIKRSGRKLYRQKGTGNARPGDRYTPVRVGGGIWGGPVPKTYQLQIPVKKRRKALISALSGKVENTKVFEKMSLEAPKAKQVREFLNTSALAGNSVLFIIDDYDKNLYLSARNLPKIQVVPVSELNAYLVANARFVLVTEPAIEKMKEVLS